MNPFDRYCECGTKLSRYNDDPLCSPCQKRAHEFESHFAGWVYDHKRKLQRIFRECLP